jgi:hypothetical protein
MGGEQMSQEQITRFTIDRAKWRTGRYGNAVVTNSPTGVSQLLNPQGFQCCLGFYLSACGLAPKELKQQAGPSEVARDFKDAVAKMPLWLLREEDEPEKRRPADSDASNKLMSLNDDVDLIDSERETKVAEEFSEHRVKVEFVGEYPQP